MSDPSTLLQTGPLRRSRTLSDSARPLMALATRLRRSVAVEAEHMQQGLVVGVGRFERELAEADWSERDISAASYLLCAWVDELVADTPWASAGPGLLQRFHGETQAGDKLLRLLSHLAEKPKENRALLELFHACLSLGLTGPLAHSPEGAQRLATLRARLYQALPQAPGQTQADGPATVAPPWRNAVADLPPPLRRRKVVALLLGFSLLLLAAYTASRLVLASRVDQVFASLRQLATPAAGVATASAPVAAQAAAATPAAGPAAASRRGRAAPAGARRAPPQRGQRAGVGAVQWRAAPAHGRGPRAAGARGHRAGAAGRQAGGGGPHRRAGRPQRPPAIGLAPVLRMGA